MVDVQHLTNQAYTCLANDYPSICSDRQQYIEAIDNLVYPLLTGRKVLDVGSGDGKRIQRLVELACPESVLCVEPSEGMFALLTANSSLPALMQSAQTFNPELSNKFDVVTCLWNVLGHIPYAELKATLVHLNTYLVSSGVLIFDVNNRHNIQYGRLVSLYRRILDQFFFYPSRGDVCFAKSAGAISTTLYGHLFTHKEVVSLLESTGFRVLRHCTVNYSNGLVSSSLHHGQHFFVALKPG